VITEHNQILESLSLDDGSVEEAVSDQNIEYDDENMFEMARC